MEQDFKKKLGKRTIQPTDMAWDRLDAMLTVAEKKKQPKRTWMFVAASFLGFLLVGTLLFKLQDTTTIIKTDAPVVIAPHDISEPEITAPQTTVVKEDILPAAKENAVVSAPKVNKSSTANTVKETTVKPDTQQQNTLITTYKEESVAFNEQLSGNNPAKAKKSIINISAQELLAAVDTDNTVRTTPKNKSQKLVEVNANSLLSSVEVELNESFREKAFEGAVKGFNVMRSSLANRNYK